jgi:hypothetical protein
MFKPPYDPLESYLAERTAEKALADAATAPPSVRAHIWPHIWRWVSEHWELLHKVWIYGVAFAVTCSVINPLAGLKEMLTVPIVTLFMGPIVMLAEMPLTFAVVLLWSVISSLWVKLGR